jgi:hypothetical protein
VRYRRAPHPSQSNAGKRFTLQSPLAPANPSSIGGEPPACPYLALTLRRSSLPAATVGKKLDDNSRNQRLPPGIAQNQA